MNKFLFTTILVASFGATSAQANEVFPDSQVTSALSGVSSEALENLQNCLRADMALASGKAIRACSKAYRDSIPLNDVRSSILTRRGLLQLSAGRFDKAGRDFKSASRLNQENEFAYLGEGFAALYAGDYAKAEQFFSDCKAHDQAAPLAAFGMAMTKELKGDIVGARESYQKAADLRPDWRAPREELARVKLST